MAVSVIQTVATGYSAVNNPTVQAPVSSVPTIGNFLLATGRPTGTGLTSVSVSDGINTWQIDQNMTVNAVFWASCKVVADMTGATITATFNANDVEKILWVIEVSDIDEEVNRFVNKGTVGVLFNGGNRNIQGNKITPQQPGDLALCSWGQEQSAETSFSAGANYTVLPNATIPGVYYDATGQMWIEGVYRIPTDQVAYEPLATGNAAPTGYGGAYGLYKQKRVAKPSVNFAGQGQNVGASPVSAASEWGFGSWVPVLPHGHPFDIVITGFTFEITNVAATDDLTAEYLFEIGTGVAGAQVTKIQIPHAVRNDTRVGYFQRQTISLPEPLEVSKDTIIWVRAADYNTAAITHNGFKIRYREVGVTGPITHYGATSMSVTFGKEVSAKRTTFGQTVTPIVFGKEVNGRRKAFGQITSPIVFGKEVVAQRKTFGQLTSPIVFGKNVVGQRKTFGQITSPFTFGISTAGFRPGLTYYGSFSLPFIFGKEVTAQRKTFGQLTSPFIFGKDVRGQRKTFSQITLPIVFSKDVKGQRKTFGQITSPFTFGISTAGFRPGLTQYGILSLPVIFGKDVNGQRKTFGQLTSPFIFGKDVRGRKQTFGQITSPFVFTATTSGIRLGITHFGAFSLPVIFGKDVRGQRRAFGQITLPLIFGKDVKAQRKTFGKIDFPIIFTKEAVGQREVFGQLSMQTLFGKETAGYRRTFSQISLPIVFSKETLGYRKTFGRVELPIDFSAFIDGKVRRTHYGSIDMDLVFNKEVLAQRKTFGQILAPFLFGSASQGQRETFGEFELPIDLLIDVESGPVGMHGELSLPIILNIETNGILRPIGIVLNEASNIYLGEIPVLAVYTENQKVWPT